jgi:hypothetical protein
MCGDEIPWCRNGLDGNNKKAVVAGAFVCWGIRESRLGRYEIGNTFPYMDGWMDRSLATLSWLAD